MKPKVLTSMLNVYRLDKVVTYQVVEQEMIMMMVVMTTRRSSAQFRKKKRRKKQNPIEIKAKV